MQLILNIDFSHLEIRCSSMDNKNYYYEKSIEMVNNIRELPRKPRLLLHVCCGPCACYPLTFLAPLFDVTIMYNNSNIYPIEEYKKRLGELKKVLANYKEQHGWNIDLIEPNYDNDSFNVDLEPYKDLPEGQTRCFICFEKRMNEAFRYANDNGFDYFTTVMSISRFKNSQKLNEIGESLQQKYKHTKYFYADFKKKNGEYLGKQISHALNLYHQQYCGCKYTFEKYQERIENEGN